MVKRKIIWSPRAKSALFGILDYYFKRNGSKIYSNKLNASLRSSIRLLENHPELGVKADIKNLYNRKTMNIITPGLSNINPAELHYQHIPRPIYPLDDIETW